MREELKNTDWHTYELSMSDYDYTNRLINQIINEGNKQLLVNVKELEAKKKDSEAISDISFYSYIDNLFLWHYGIWRLQGIFESILKQNYFTNKNLIRLKVKLDYT